MPRRSRACPPQPCGKRDRKSASSSNRRAQSQGGIGRSSDQCGRPPGKARSLIASCRVATASQVPTGNVRGCIFEPAEDSAERASLCAVIRSRLPTTGCNSRCRSHRLSPLWLHPHRMQNRIPVASLGVFRVRSFPIPGCRTSVEPLPCPRRPRRRTQSITASPDGVRAALVWPWLECPTIRRVGHLIWEHVGPMMSSATLNARDASCSEAKVPTRSAMAPWPVRCRICLAMVHLLGASFDGSGAHGKDHAINCTA